MKNYILLITMAALLLTSCGNSKQFVYFQDMQENEKYAMTKMQEMTIQPDDRLGITVSCKSPELAAPFNNQVGNYQVSIDGTASVEAAQPQASTKTGYLVNADGNIQYPILGTLHLEGMTLIQAADLIKSQISKGGYIKNPQVNIEFLNFKYTILGATGSSVHTVDGERITVLEALAQSGDIADNGRVNNVTVIRENNGAREVYKIDLRSKKLFDSPGFYLKQNDVVYVEPKYRGQEAYQKKLNYITTTTSTISSITTIVLLMITLGIIG